jgi:hypothetical protein
MRFLLAILLTVPLSWHPDWGLPPDDRLPPVSPRAVDTGWQLNDATDIRLDGRPCRLEDVPDNAEVERLDLWQGTVIRLWFRSHVRP